MNNECERGRRGQARAVAHAGSLPSQPHIESAKSANSSDKKDPRTYAIIGAAMEVHRELGSGFLEAVYQEALGREFAARGIPHRAQAEIPIHYKGERLDAVYRADFICFEEVIVELKALKSLSGVEQAQVMHYLKATRLQVGLLLNFGGVSLEYQRLVYSKSAKLVDNEVDPQISQIAQIGRRES